MSLSHFIMVSECLSKNVSEPCHDHFGKQEMHLVKRQYCYAVDLEMLIYRRDSLENAR